METSNPLLIVIDPGHGGEDFGAMWEGRLEKDDNLRLGLAVRDALANQGVEVLMTRDSDVFIPLPDRTVLANDANADLFVSLHRNSYPEQTPTSNGVENIIYLTAPAETSGKAAQAVLDAVTEVGVQSNRGVTRGNYYVLRKSGMPAMLLEMGFIIDDTDNLLFDQNLNAYAEAIAKGILNYFGLPYRNPGSPNPVPDPGQTGRPPSPRTDLTVTAQQALNHYFGTQLVLDGVYGPATGRAVLLALSRVLSNLRGVTLPLEGTVGPEALSMLPTLREGDTGSAVVLLQILLHLRGYDTGSIDATFGSATRNAVELFQRDNYLLPNGVAGPGLFSRLLL